MDGDAAAAAVDLALTGREWAPPERRLAVSPLTLQSLSMKRNTIEAILRWLEAFDGAGYTLLFPALAAGLRLLLFAVDHAVADG